MSSTTTSLRSLLVLVVLPCYTVYTTVVCVLSFVYRAYVLEESSTVQYEYMILWTTNTYSRTVSYFTTSTTVQ